MALFLDRRSGQTVPSKLREVFPDSEAVPEGCAGPVYVLDTSDDDEQSRSVDSLSDDESYHDALEELPPQPKPVPLPDEILTLIMRNVEELDGEEAYLKACSLVCKAWSSPARRLLFGGILAITSADSARNLRNILEAHPDLQDAVQKVDLTSAMREGSVAPFYRRAAALLRCTTNVSTLQLLHVGLSPKNRRRFHSALRRLPLNHLILYSSSWSITHNRGNIGDHADTREILRLLCGWTELESLSLNGYSSYPRLLLPSIAPVHTFPTYRLRDLHLLSCSLADSTLLWLLGNSAKSLKQLNLGGCSGLTSDILALVFEVIGPTLESLIITLDADDLSVTSGARSIRCDIVKGLVQLRTVSLSTDSVFREEILHDLIALPELESVSLCYPSFTYAVVKEALASAPPTSKLEKLYLDAWETPDMWTQAERWDIMQMCDKRAVELVLNGLIRADVEEEWYGEDLSEDWGVLEDPSRSSRWEVS
ncbi:hypothetical protein JCM10908_002995 [Rhodotorula pacifica]|uniref:uncharacterized protein n=1 Tax=Rhodotorula pacifica TaxID=1495444 RepID=UPI00317F723E